MADEKMRELAKAIKVLRAEKGFTQEKLAKKSGVSVCAIALIENCKKKARVGTVVKLASAFEVEYETLLKYVM